MSKKFVNVQQYITRREQICRDLNNLADTCEAEKREFTDDEKAQIETLKREKDVLELRINAANGAGMVAVEDKALAFDKVLREVANGGKRVEGALKRENLSTANAIMSTTTNVQEGLVPVSIQAIIKPLEQGLILQQLGMPLYTGLYGDFVFPTIGAVEATVAGEGVEIGDSTINFDKIKPEPKRVAISITITRETIFKTDGVAMDIIMQQIPEAMWRTLNKCMFNTEATAIGIDGPFYALAKLQGVAISTLKTRKARAEAKKVLFAGELPTYKELLAMKGIALAKGVQPEMMAYIMDEYTKSQLEAEPRSAGSGLMCIENGMIAGIPVKCTNYINQKGTDEVPGKTFVGFGCWGNQILQGFGEISMIVDPYSAKKKNAIEITLNSDWAAATLRHEAFVLGECAAS